MIILLQENIYYRWSKFVKNITNSSVKTMFKEFFLLEVSHRLEIKPIYDI